MIFKKITILFFAKTTKTRSGVYKCVCLFSQNSIFLLKKSLLMENQSYSKPYPNLDISDYSYLFNITGRFICERCKRSRKFYCYTCGTNVNEHAVPKVNLPFKIDIIKHKQEVDGKSTSCHAKMLANDDVRIFEYPEVI